MDTCQLNISETPRNIETDSNVFQFWDLGKFLTRKTSLRSLVKEEQVHVTLLYVGVLLT